MNSDSAAKIIKALPTFGFLLFLSLGFCINVGSPTMDLIHFGYIPFLVGYTIYAVAVLLLTLSLGSFSALVRLTTPRSPSFGICLFVIAFYGLIGFIWAGVSWSSVELTKTLTANEEITLDGTLASFYRRTTRSKCYRTAVFTTNLGEMEVCASGSRTLLPLDLHMGEHVRLLGRKNNYTFVLRKIIKDR